MNTKEEFDYMRDTNKKAIAYLASLPIGTISNWKLMKAIRPATLWGVVGVATLAGVIEIAAERGIYEAEVKIESLIEKRKSKKGINYAKYEVVNEERA